MSGSNDSISNPAAKQPTDWFDIDSFLDDYVTDLGNQDPLGDINLDFSLPFPASKQTAGVHNSHTLPRLTPTLHGLVPAATIPLPQVYTLPTPQELDHLTMSEAEDVSEEEEPSVQEDIKPIRTRGRRASTRGGAATSKTTTGGASARAKKAERMAEPRNVTQQRKHQALQEKNRRAQRRFRERQKNRVTELEDQVAALTTQLTTITFERDVLAQRNMELEDALANNNTNDTTFSDHAHGKANNNNVPPESPHQHTGLNASSPLDPSSQPPSPGATAQTADNSFSADGHSPSALCAQGMTLTPKRGGSPIILTPRELCTMSQPVLSMHFGALVKGCAQTLVEGAGNPDSAERLCHLVDQALTLWHRVGQCNPTAGKKFATCSLDESARGSPADERAPQIVRSLSLTDRQKTDMCNLRKLFLQRVNTIAASRSAAVNQTSLSSTGLAGVALYGGISGRSLALHQLAARQASHHISNSLQEEHITAVEFETTVTKHVLAPAQAAQLLIHSFPWPPDCLSLTTWVAAESGEADAVAALTAEAQARAATTAAAVAGSSDAMMVPVSTAGAAAAAAAAAGGYKAMTTTAGAGAGIGAGGSSMQSPFVLPNPCHGSLMAAAAAVGATSSVNTYAMPQTRHHR